MSRQHCWFWGGQLYNVQGDPNLLSPLAKLSGEATGPASITSAGLDTIIRKREWLRIQRWTTSTSSGERVICNPEKGATIGRVFGSVGHHSGYLYLFPSSKLSPSMSLDLVSLSLDGFISISRTPHRRSPTFQAKDLLFPPFQQYPHWHLFSI